MIVDSSWLASNGLPPVAIIGSGPAGMSLALRLEAQGVPSIIFEAGDDSASAESQDFYRGEVVGDPYFDLDVARLRMVGGSSNHWGGWCRPLEEFDFVEREGIPHTGWPIAKSDLDPYEGDTAEILETGAFGSNEFSPEIMKITIKVGNPVNFLAKYWDHIAQSDAITMMTNTAVAHIEAENGRVSALVLRSGPDGEEVRVTPQRVVLACGGIENSRLLLWSNDVSAEPVVPQSATLGRYWMEHPTFVVGEAKLHDSFARQVHGDDFVAFLAPRFEAMQQHGVLNANLRVYQPRPNQVGQVLCTGLRMTTATYAATARHFACSYLVGMSWEQAPDPDNRIELGNERDAFGVPRPVLHWRKTDLDLKTARVNLELFGKSVIDGGFGNARAMDFILGESDYPTDDELAGYHHMGGTRMSDSAQTGVVDSNLKVFGMDNLYVAGSSVYPTGGHANPTFTIVQLSLRLGDHLAGQLAA